MTAKRVAAVLIAAALIVAAVLIRNGLDDDSSSATNGTANPSSGGKATVVCSTEFKAVCATLDPKKYTVTIEPAGVTFDRLAANDGVTPNAWVTLDPFPGMVDAARSFASFPPFSSTVTAVATDEPVLAVAKSVAKQIATLCPAPITWKCAGANAGKAPADVNVKLLLGIINPASEADGLLSLANGVAGYFGSAVLTSASWENSDFTGWLRNLGARRAKEEQVGGDPLSTLASRPSAVNVAATTESKAKTSAQPDKFLTVAVDPAIALTAVVAVYDSRASALPAQIGAALSSAGWTAGAASAQLDAGTFIALRKLWKDFNK